MRLLLIFLCFITQQAFAQVDSVTLIDYNLLNYSENDTDRTAPFQTIFNELDPDILVVQEVESEAGMDLFLSEILGTDYARCDFINGYDSDNGLFYRHDLFNCIENKPIKTQLRDINQFTLVHLGSQKLFYVFSLHLRASPGFEYARAAEIDSLRKAINQLPEDALYIVAGDFNIYGDYEPAYMRLMLEDIVDPLTLTGIWNSPVYAQYHTQSTRKRQFGGGASGGLDDRFDMILYSETIQQPSLITYVENSTIPFGNDALHYDDSINHVPNVAVGNTLADALHMASDHLPLSATFVFDPLMNTEESTPRNALKLYPTYVRDWMHVEIPREGVLHISNSVGQQMSSIAVQKGTQKLSMDHLPYGVYMVSMEVDGRLYVARFVK